jgi:hypothetical protein
MDNKEFYSDTIAITFSKLPIFWKSMIIIGSISSVIFFILLVIIVSLMFESKMVTKKEQDLSEYDDFLNEFANGKKDNAIEKDEDGHEQEEYPSLPKIRDFDGNVLRDLMRIEIL